MRLAAANRYTLIGIVATALLTAACGDDSLPSLGDAVTVSPPPAAAPIPDTATLRGAILSAEQLPAGFGQLPDPSELGSPPASGAEPTDTSSTDPAECAAVLAPVADISPGSESRALSRFQGVDFTSIDIDAASYTPSEVAAAFAHVQELFGLCVEYTGTDGEGIEVTYQLGALELAATGDASVAIRLLTESEGITLTTDVVVMVIGTTMVQFAATGPEPIDQKVFSELVGKQADQIRAFS